MTWYIVVIGYLTSAALVPHVLLARKRPIATLAWIWFIVAFPFVGALIYLIFGADRMKRRRLRRVAKANLSKRPMAEITRERLLHVESPMRELLSSLSNINQVPLSTVESPRLLINADQFYPALIRRIDEAQHHVHIEFFVWRDDEEGRPILERLIAARKRGVEVRILLDQMGCWGLKRSAFREFSEVGGEFSWFYSVPFGRHFRFMNLRNHRKLQIIDGQTAFVGGMNLGREYAGKDPAHGMWRDAQMELRGEVVTFLQEIFATDWFFATQRKLSGPDYYPRLEKGKGSLCQVIGGGPDMPREPLPNSLAAICTSATKRLWVATGYFVPDSVMLSAFQICGARGVDVRVLISEKSDHPYLVEVGRSYYQDLLRYGIRIFEYSKGINHTKALLLDDDWLMLGSANCDVRSMRLNFELNVMINSPEQAAALEQMMLEDFAASTEITSEQYRQRPLRQQVLEAALRPLAPLL